MQFFMILGNFSRARLFHILRCLNENLSLVNSIFGFSILKQYQLFTKNASYDLISCKWFQSITPYQYKSAGIKMISVTCRNIQIILTTDVLLSDEL